MRTLLELDGFKTLLKPGVTYAQVETSQGSRFRGVLPDIVVNTWSAHGLLKFRDGPGLDSCGRGDVDA